MKRQFISPGAESCYRRTARWRWLLRASIISISLSSTGCGQSGLAPRVDNTAATSINREASKVLSDSFADDLLQERRAAIEAKLEKDFRKSVTQKEVDSILAEMTRAYGKPLEFEFKHDELGLKSYPEGKTKQARKFWYAAKTTKYDKGNYFLIVEIIPDEDGLAVSGFSMVNFPLGVPPNLR